MSRHEVIGISGSTWITTERNRFHDTGEAHHFRPSLWSLADQIPDDTPRKPWRWKRWLAAFAVLVFLDYQLNIGAHLAYIFGRVCH